MKYYLNTRQVDIVEAVYVDGVIEVKEAYFTQKNDSSYGVNLTDDELEVLEAAYQESLLAEYYGDKLDQAEYEADRDWIE